MGKYPTMFLIPVEVTLTALSSSQSVTLQIPDGGLRIIQYRVTGVCDSNTAGAGTSLMLVPPEDMAGVADDIVVSIKSKQSIINYTESPVSIWALDVLHKNRMWKGDWYPPRTQLEFTFTDQAFPARYTLPIDVRVECFGYIGDEESTFNFTNTIKYSQTYF